MSKKQKFYVVWQGAKPGVYTSWDDCAKQVNGFAGARYKSFDTRAAADAAFAAPPQATPKIKTKQTRIAASPFIRQSIAVDAAWNTATLNMEYRGVEVWSGNEIFHQGPYAHGTNNVGEFLAIVHALAWLKQRDSALPVYSDSRTAIAWVKKKKANTKLEAGTRNHELFDAMQRAESWLERNDYPNAVLKWETESWGENPADFGRK